jgi:hypothetical protein
VDYQYSSTFLRGKKTFVAAQPMPLLQLTCRFHLNILVNCCGSEAIQSGMYAEPTGTIAEPSGSHAEISATVPQRQPQHPALSVTGSSEKDLQLCLFLLKHPSNNGKNEGSHGLRSSIPRVLVPYPTPRPYQPKEKTWPGKWQDLLNF